MEFCLLLLKYIEVINVGEVEWGVKWVEEDKIKEKIRVRFCGVFNDFGFYLEWDWKLLEGFELGILM